MEAFENKALYKAVCAHKILDPDDSQHHPDRQSLENPFDAPKLLMNPDRFPKQLASLRKKRCIEEAEKGVPDEKKKGEAIPTNSLLGIYDRQMNDRFVHRSRNPSLILGVNECEPDVMKDRILKEMVSGQPEVVKRFGRNVGIITSANVKPATKRLLVFHRIQSLLIEMQYDIDLSTDVNRTDRPQEQVMTAFEQFVGPLYNPQPKEEQKGEVA